MFCGWKVFTGLYDAKQRCKERVPLISLVIAPIAIGPASHKAQDAHFTQLILNSTKSQSAQAHQLADIALPWRTAEKQAQHCCPHAGKQHIKNRHTAFHMLGELNSTALHSQVHLTANWNDAVSFALNIRLREGKEIWIRVILPPGSREASCFTSGMDLCGC